MEHDSGKPPTNSFDRFEEYKVVLVNYAAIQSRRQTATNLFMSLNLAFLGAVGFLVLLSRLNSWWAIGALGALTLVVMPVNLTWFRVMNRYAKVIVHDYSYLQDIETELRKSQADRRAGMPEIGLYLRQGDVDHIQHRGTARLERELAVYFLLLYPAVTGLTAILTYLIINHIVPPLTLG